jgi:hypothetical protein
VALVRKAADQIIIDVLFKTFGIKKINKLLITGDKLTNNFADLVTSCLEPDVAFGPPARSHLTARREVNVNFNEPYFQKLRPFQQANFWPCMYSCACICLSWSVYWALYTYIYLFVHLSHLCQSFPSLRNQHTCKLDEAVKEWRLVLHLPMLNLVQDTAAVKVINRWK